MKNLIKFSKFNESYRLSAQEVNEIKNLIDKLSIREKEVIKIELLDFAQKNNLTTDQLTDELFMEKFLALKLGSRDKVGGFIFENWLDRFESSIDKVLDKIGDKMWQKKELMRKIGFGIQTITIVFLIIGSFTMNFTTVGIITVILLIIGSVLNMPISDEEKDDIDETNNQ